MIKIKFIPNIQSPEGRLVKELPYFHWKTVREYIYESGFDSTNMRVVVSNQKKADLDGVLEEDQEIILCPDITWGAIVAIASAIWSAALAHPFIFWAYALTISYSIYSMMSAPKAPNYGASGSGMDESSPTYGWDGVQTTQSIGTPIPIIYGEHKAGGNIINQYVRTDGQKQFLHTLLALCEGEIDSVSSIKINNNPIANFSGVTTTTKVGTNSQTLVPDFEDLHQTYSQNVQLLKNAAYVYTTTGTDIEAFELTLQCVNGLFQQDSNGNVLSWAVTYKVEYKLHAAGTYTDLGSTTLTDKTRSVVRTVFRKDGLTAGQYDIRITKTSDDVSLSPLKEGDLYLKQVDEVTTEDLAYPNVALLGVDALATEQLSGSTPNFTCIVKGKLISQPRIMNGGAEVAWADYYWDPATSQWKLLSDGTVLSWDGTTYVTKWSANPIWCIKDLLTSDRYGLGELIDSTELDSASFLAMAKYCDERVSDGAGSYEKRFRLDCVIDSAGSATDILTQICATFRAFPFYIGNTINIKIDKADTPVQLFGMGNIIEGTFQQGWKSIKDVPNVIEIQFIDKDKDYAQDTIAVIDETAMAANQPIRKRELRLFCTRLTQAIREGKYALNIGKYINRSITFRAGIDSIACTSGDVINVSHDVPQWGFSGRVITGSTTTNVKLDQPVTIGAGTYKIRVRFADDTQEEKTINESPGTYTDVDVSSAFSQVPAAYDVYSVGLTDMVVKPFRIMSITRFSDTEAEINAIEYDADVYDTDTITKPENNYSALSLTVPVVTGVNTVERNTVQPDGSVDSIVDVFWDKPDDTGNFNKYQSAKIYMSDDSGAHYQLVGQSVSNFFPVVFNFVVGQAYYFKVLTVCSNGIEDTLTNAPSDNITITGKIVKPGNVSGFAYTWADLLLLYWNANTEKDLAGYEVRDEDANWGTDSAHMIYRGLATKKTLQLTSRSPGTYYIKAFNNSGVYGNTAASITPTNSVPSSPTSLNSNVAWNTATVYWTDTADTDIKYYEVYRSDTNLWAGEEELLARVSGKSFTFEAERSRSGSAQSGSANTIVDSALIGLGDDYFNGDTITIASGTGAGQTRTISDFTDSTGTIQVSSNWGVNPDATSKFLITDACYIKVRGVDDFGEGAFSASLLIQFTNFDENAFGDSVVTARKIYVACLSAISGNMGCLTAGVIQGGTIQTGASGARTLFDGTGIYSYDASCCKQFEVKDGCICAGSIKLFDMACSCNYSYLSSGALKFHDALGDVPYVKRIDSGTVCTGCYVILNGWTTPPEVFVGIKSLLSYNSSNSAQCQKWDIYADTPVWYCTSATCYGYCFMAHASLIVAEGTGVEVVKDYAFGGTTSCTATCVCKTQVRSKFQLWCNGACTNYCYGTICYNICYRKVGDPTYCVCQYSYVQPHASTTELKTNYDDCRILTFPCNQQWEILNTQQSIAWTDSGFPSYQCLWCCLLCCCNGTYWTYGFTCTIYGAACTMNILYACCQTAAGNCCALCTATVTFTGFPANVYCSIVYWCYSAAPTIQGHNFADPAVWYVNNGGAPAICFCDGAQTVGITLVPGSCDCVCSGGAGRYCKTSAACQATWNMYACVRAQCWCKHTCICAPAYCICQVLTYCCLCNCQYTVDCSYWYCTGAAASCCYEQLYSLCDTYGCFCVLDPNGMLNWLAIAYS